MNSNHFFKKSSIILFAIVIVLLVANVVVKKIVEKGERPKSRESLSGIEVDNSFNTALKNYGFSSNWIKKQKLKNINDDSLFATYKIQIPRNLPVHLLILELQDLLWNDDVKIISEESQDKKSTIVKLISDDHLKLAAEFDYNESIFREFGTLSFLIYDFPAEDKEKINELLKTPELFYVVLQPSESSKKLLSLLTKENKRYALLLDDDITELNYKLDPGYSEDRLKRSIREIVGTFANAAFIIVDDRSDLYESSKYHFIENEFVKRNIKLIPKSSLSFLEENKIGIESRFSDFMMGIKKNEERVLLVSADDFLSIAELIPAYRKIGYKFIYPGDIIIKR